MSTLAKAIVTDGAGHFELDEVELGDPHHGEVLIEINVSVPSTIQRPGSAPHKLNAVLGRSTLVAALGGMLFGFDTAVIAGNAFFDQHIRSHSR